MKVTLTRKAGKGDSGSSRGSTPQPGSSKGTKVTLKVGAAKKKIADELRDLADKDEDDGDEEDAVHSEDDFVPDAGAANEKKVYGKRGRNTRTKARAAVVDDEEEDVKAPQRKRAKLEGEAADKKAKGRSARGARRTIDYSDDDDDDEEMVDAASDEDDLPDAAALDTDDEFGDDDRPTRAGQAAKKKKENGVDGAKKAASRTSSSTSKTSAASTGKKVSSTASSAASSSTTGAATSANKACHPKHACEPRSMLPLTNHSNLPLLLRPSSTHKHQPSAPAATSEVLASQAPPPPSAAPANHPQHQTPPFQRRQTRLRQEHVQLGLALRLHLRPLPTTTTTNTANTTSSNKSTPTKPQPRRRHRGSVPTRCSRPLHRKRWRG